MATTHTQDHRHLLLRIVEEAYRQSTWNGTNLRASLESVPAAAAGWHPPHAAHNIAEIVLHSAYWKFAVRKRLTGDETATFALDGEDWFDVPGDVDEDRWAELLAVLDDEHRELSRAIKQSERELDYGSRSGRDLVRQLFGIAMHDAYHTGQIHLVQAQQKRAKAG